MRWQQLRNVKTPWRKPRGVPSCGRVGTFLCSPPTTKVVTTGVSRSNSSVSRYRECRILPSGKVRSRTIEASVRRCARGRAARSGGNCPGPVLEPDAKRCEGREARLSTGAARGLDSARAPSDRRERPRAAHRRRRGLSTPNDNAVRSRSRSVSCYCAKQCVERVCVEGRAVNAGDSV